MMTKSLFFTPKAQPGESAGSIILRLAEAHTERPSSYFIHFTQKHNAVSRLLRDMYSRSAPEVAALLDLTNWHTQEHTIRTAAGRNHSKWMDFKLSKVCTECADEGWTPDLHDYKIVTCCTRHKVKLRTHCNHCGDALRWNRYGLTRCHCFELIEPTEAASESELEVTNQLESWIKEGDDQKLAAYKSLKEALNTRISSTDDWAPSVIDYVNGDPRKLAAMMNPFFRSARPLSARAMVASLICTSFTVIKQALPALSDILENLPECSESKALPENFHLTRAELLFALGCKGQTIDMLLERKVLISSYAEGSFIKKRVKLTELKRLYRYFSTSPNQKSHSVTLAELADSSHRKTADLISDLFSGNLTPAGADSWRLSDWRVCVPAGYSNDVPDGYSTLSMAQKILGGNSAYIAGYRRSGLLTAHTQRNKNNRYLYKTRELHDFRNKYITAGQIASLTQSPVTVITDKLRYAGIVPVSGPGVDSSPVFLFLRSEINAINLSETLSVREKYSTSGRRSFSSPRVDPHQWMTAAQAAKELGLSHQLLYQLVENETLIATRPENAESKVSNYFLRKQVSTVKQDLARMVDVDQLAARSKVSRKQVLNRLWRLLKSKPMKYQGAARVNYQQAQQLQKHFSLYWDAAQAAAYLNVTTHQIHNWKRLGHLDYLRKRHPDYIESPILFDCEEIKNFRRP